MEKSDCGSESFEMMEASLRRWDYTSGRNLFKCTLYYHQWHSAALRRYDTKIWLLLVGIQFYHKILPGKSWDAFGIFFIRDEFVFFVEYVGNVSRRWTQVNIHSREKGEKIIPPVGPLNRNWCWLTKCNSCLRTATAIPSCVFSDMLTSTSLIHLPRLSVLICSNRALQCISEGLQFPVWCFDYSEGGRKGTSKIWLVWIPITS